MSRPRPSPPIDPLLWEAAELAVGIVCRGSEEEHRRAIELLTRKCGPDHGLTLRAELSLIGLGMLQRRFIEACERLPRELARFERLLGRGHRDTLELRQYLAVALQGCGELRASERQFRVLLADGQRALGRRSTPARLACRGLVGVLTGQRKYGQALPFIQRLQKAHARRYGCKGAGYRRLWRAKRECEARAKAWGQI